MALDFVSLRNGKLHCESFVHW